MLPFRQLSEPFDQEMAGQEAFHHEPRDARLIEPGQLLAQLPYCSQHPLPADLAEQRNETFTCHSADGALIVGRSDYVQQADTLRSVVNYQERHGAVPKITPGAAKATFAAVTGQGHFDTADLRDNLFAISGPGAQTGKQFGSVHREPKKIGIASPYRVGRQFRQNLSVGHSRCRPRYGASSSDQNAARVRGQGRWSRTLGCSAEPPGQHRAGRVEQALAEASAASAELRVLTPSG